MRHKLLSLLLIVEWLSRQPSLVVRTPMTVVKESRVCGASWKLNGAGDIQRKGVC